MKIILLVIDGFGIGEMPDSHLFGDEGSNTYVNIINKTSAVLTNLISLGLNNIDGIPFESYSGHAAAVARLGGKTLAKDTTAGHYELAGIVMKEPYKTFNRFPENILREIEHKADCEFMGNEVASGTEIIQRLGEEHRASKKPIIYTSADSVMQIAADIDIIPLERLYAICRVAREIMVGSNAVGRIIARPFKKFGDNYQRTSDRKDFALFPPKATMLDKLKDNNFDVIGVGKISDIFNGRGITRSYPTKNNLNGLNKLVELSKADINGLIFANLNDTDMLFGHRNDYEGYASALIEIDNTLPDITRNLKEEDILIITSDHGCDPTTSSTDHSREYVPLLIYGNKILPKNHGTINGLDIVAKSILDYFGIEKNKESLI